MDAARYYRELTGHYQDWGGSAFGWHYGFSEASDHDRDAALLRSNELLVEGLALGKGARVLDVGFGNGGLAVWLAARSGCHVTGVSLVEEHVPLAAALAEERGVADRCRFLPMDMNKLDFEPASFDLVTNQETFCYAADKRAYLERVRDVLRPGGSWRAIVMSIGEAPLAAEQRAIYDDVCAGYHLAGFLPFPETRRMLEEAGFEEVRMRDLTSQALPTAAELSGLCRAPLWLIRLRLDWIAYSRDPVRRRNRQGHVQATDAFCRGLFDGSFRLVRFSASKPG